MKNSAFLFFILLFCLLGFTQCTEKETPALPEDNIGQSIEPVTQLKAVSTDEEEEIKLSWVNPDDEHLLRVEISYQVKSIATKSSPNPVLVQSVKATESTLILKVPEYATYVITAVAINKAGAQSTEVTVEGIPYLPTAEETDNIPIFLKRADTLMTSLAQLFLNGKPRDIWSSTYPQSDGYWDGAAVIWGHGAAFSGYSALKEAAKGFPEFEAKYQERYDERLLTSIDKFRNTKNGKAEAYAVYPGEGDERYFDDNIWVGIDMVNLYMLTKEPKYLDRAKLVWNFVLTGTDNIMGGGVYWKEYGNSKNTCSTAPSAVLAAKLYQATKEEMYLQHAKDLYAWCKNTLQDPSDYLYWDNVRLSDENDPNSDLVISKQKYTYNSGQSMQAAALLYAITNEGQYLTDAQNIAKSAYEKWFIPFHSYTLAESFRILEPGSVWFQAIMFRGFVELYKIDGNRTYVTAYEKTLANAWLSNCRNEGTNLLNGDFRGGTSQTKWEILHQGACLEMLARLASLERDDL